MICPSPTDRLTSVRGEKPKGGSTDSQGKDHRANQTGDSTLVPGSTGSMDKVLISHNPKLVVPTGIGIPDFKHRDLLHVDLLQ